MQMRLLWIVMAGVMPIAGKTQPPSGSWRVISEPKSPTVVAFDTSRITKLPHGRLDVWERFTLHPPRHDPAGVVGSIVMRVVVDCAAQQTALRSVAKYAPSGALISQTPTYSITEDDFSDEAPGSLDASALHGICSALNLAPAAH